MLLALLGSAVAAPLSPVGMQDEPLSLEVAATYSVDRTYLAAFADTCTGDNCDALRITFQQGAQIDLRIVKYVGVYGAFAHAHEKTAAAVYEGDGWAARAGVKGTIPLAASLGIDAWGGVDAARTDTGAEADAGYARARRVDGLVGAALHGGSPQDNFIGWIGAEAVVFTDDRTLVLDRSVELALHPGLPASVDAGFLIVSGPLGAPWSQRGHIGAGVSGSAGFRTGLQLWLSGSF